MLHSSVKQIKPIVQAAIPFMAPELQHMAAKIAYTEPRLASRAWEAAEMVMSGHVTIKPGTPYPYHRVAVSESDSRQWHTVTRREQTWLCNCGAGRFCIHELAAVFADEDDEEEVALGELITALKGQAIPGSM